MKNTPTLTREEHLAEFVALLYAIITDDATAQIVLERYGKKETISLNKYLSNDILTDMENPKPTPEEIHSVIRGVILELQDVGLKSEALVCATQRESRIICQVLGEFLSV